MENIFLFNSLAVLNIAYLKNWSPNKLNRQKPGAD